MNSIDGLSDGDVISRESTSRPRTVITTRRTGVIGRDNSGISSRSSSGLVAPRRSSFVTSFAVGPVGGAYLIVSGLQVV